MLLLSSYTFIFSHILLAQSNFHPALIMKLDSGDSFTSDKVYISFVGCGPDNTSVIDQLPMKLEALASELAMTKLQLSGLTKNVENLTKELARMREATLDKSKSMPLRSFHYL